MMRSLFSGVSGLINHQTRMDVIGNNIANVNTVGFKAGRVNFSDVLSQTLQGASSTQGGIGGTNPMQVGLGMGLASVDTIFTDGTFQNTGKSTDLSIHGQGFFIVSDGTNQYYTRAGNFDFDTAGNYLLPGTGLKVMGYMADATGAINPTGGDISEINIPVGDTMPAKATTSINFANNLSADAEVGTVVTTAIDVYDSLGIAHKVNQTFIKANDNKWLVLSKATGGNVTAGDVYEVSFDAYGNMKGICDANLSPSTAAYNTATTIPISMLDNTPGSVHVSQYVVKDADDATAATTDDAPHKLTMTVTNTQKYDAASTTNGIWSYEIIEQGTGITKTGTLTYNATTQLWTNSNPAEAITVKDKSGDNQIINFSALTGIVPGDNMIYTHVDNAIEISNMQLDNTAKSTHSINYVVFDTNKTPHVFTMEVTNTKSWVAGQSDGVWSYTISEQGNPNAEAVSGSITYAQTAPATGTWDYQFSPIPGLSYLEEGQTASVSVPFLVGLSQAPTANTFEAASTLDYTPAAGSPPPVTSLTLTPNGGAQDMAINMDYSTIKQTGGTSTLQATTQTGYASGTLDTLSISEGGIIIGKFTNGESKQYAQVALATFSNPGGLNKSGESLYTKSNNSGVEQIGTAGSGGRGTVSPNTLEMANVDLAQEFSNMIVTQRGFQANSKIITTVDEMLQELANLKR